MRSNYGRKTMFQFQSRKTCCDGGKNNGYHKKKIRIIKVRDIIGECRRV